MPFVVNREQLAWAAGLFEGEGCLSTRGKSVNILRKYRDRGLVAAMKMTDEDVIFRFKQIVGVGNITGPYNKIGKKTWWVWQAGSFEHVQALIAILWPWLCRRRKDRAKELLTLYHASAAELSRKVTRKYGKIN